MTRDHPRSRGVYPLSASSVSPDSGSSPLARGLRLLLPGPPLRPGIIPARAGFTARATRARDCRPDHPRSRGVYSTTHTDETWTWGSSPLARGLPESGADQTVLLRIIPARAGFTPGSGEWRTGSADHPRSRGVYAGLNGYQVPARGSSPLARGLRMSGTRRPTLGGIIPARAGFTTGTRSRCRRRCGSSPLARGLPPAKTAENMPRRIIPARAGFTRRAGHRAGTLRDHPRSRGVYNRTALRRRGRPGSSPLARGLRPPRGLLLYVGGIIPARAGFTGRVGLPT